MLKRSRIRAVRPSLRRGEPTKAEKQAARVACWERAGGMCEMRESPQCKVGPLPLDGYLLERMHLAHLKSKRRFGWQESNEQRHLCACSACHAYQHNGGKPVPVAEWRQRS